ncbi:MAG: chromosome segregation protein SMC, partial [Candidatus Rokubacteria bacterium]|nr:chromosome segregation protein SMC [Candidatus Rokubacteria bacterium]
YDLTVADTHNFVAANVIVHNSNIGECVRWALGEQSAKSLRGHRMDDLIFHGSASRKPVGLAEVELMFTNDDELSIPYSEIAVARRLFRTGDSEYLLNKQPCRLRDIFDLFAGTGANPRAYSVMDQDKLNHVLTAKPHERRVFIEEAAGIARYKQQRNETQGKLDGTRQNLVRVRDVMDEVRRQLTSLERQAKKATQYKALQAEKRELALTVMAADHAALTTGTATLEREIAELRDRSDVLRGRVAVLAGREAIQREAIQASEHRLSDIRQSVQKVQGELERLLERREQMGVQLREAEEESTRLEAEIRGTAERLSGLADERGTARSALADAEALVAERASAAAALDARVEAHRSTLASDRDRLEALRLEQMRLASERTDLMRSAGELRERQSQLQRRAERLAGEIAQAEAEAETLAGRRVVVESARERALHELGSLAAQRVNLETTLRDREQALAEATAALSEIRVTLAARRSSLESLQEVTRVREGYGAGVRAIFAEGQASGLAGVVGTVADLIDVPVGLERPIAAVLADRLEWIVVERFNDARAAVAFLESRRAGSATFLPLECLVGHGGNGNGHGSEPPQHAEGVRWVASEVRAGSDGLIRHLLGGVAIVDDLDRAEALWRRNGVVATYVTPAGEVLTPTGGLRGGGEAAAHEHALLARKRELRELEDEVAALELALGDAQQRVGALETETSALRARLPGVHQAIATNEAARVANEKDLEQSVREQERVHRHRETIALEIRQVDSQTRETDETVGRLERRIEIAREAETAHESAMAGLRDTIEAARAREAEIVAELTACRVELAAATERAEALGRELTRLDQIEADLDQRATQARARQTQNAERSSWLAAERERTDVAAREVAVERDRIEEDARAAAARHEELQTELRTIDGETRGLEAELRSLTTSSHEREITLTEHRVRREELLQEARRAWNVDEAELATRHDPERDLDAVRARVTELDEKLDAIGAVNLVADDEYRELDERLTFLRTQHDDLVASVKDLEKALRGMTRTAQERFTQAFDEINRHFAEIFGRLFEGGRAELRLVEAEDGGDPFDTGVDLMAQPRGKRLQSVTLMSGGERALTGLALLFAIFYYRPSPFCVLDEVDAPLDDANIYRFLRVLRELTSQTQFIVITHNRKTMEAADILYGVTMEEAGLSKLVSVSLAG